MRDPRAAYGRIRNRPVPTTGEERDDTGLATYYGRPALKPSPWDWMVAAYIFIAGLAGSAQIIATAADLLGGERARTVVRNGRYLALAGSIAGPPLLIADLKTPQRWYNMLRIFRRTSPMSIGSYILTSFGFFTALTALGQYRGDRRGGRRTLPRRAASATQIPAALTGAGMSTYTGALLSATSTPLWAAAPGPLAAQFGGSAMATAAAALSLAEQADGEPNGNSRTLDRVAMVAVSAELVASAVAERRYRATGVASPLRNTAWGTAHKVGAVAVGAGLPLACYALNELRGPRCRSPGLSIAASLAVLAGGMVLRQAILHAGIESAKRPADYFRFAGPENLPPPSRAERLTTGEPRRRLAEA